MDVLLCSLPCSGNKIVKSWHGFLENKLKKISDSISVTSSWSTHLSEAAWLLVVASPERAHLLLAASWEIIRTKGWGIIYTYFENSALLIPGYDISFFSLRAISVGLVGIPRG